MRTPDEPVRRICQDCGAEFEQRRGKNEFCEKCAAARQRFFGKVRQRKHRLKTSQEFGDASAASLASILGLPARGPVHRTSDREQIADHLSKLDRRVFDCGTHMRPVRECIREAAASLLARLETASGSDAWTQRQVVRAADLIIDAGFEWPGNGTRIRALAKATVASSLDDGDDGYIGRALLRHAAVERVMESNNKQIADLLDDSVDFLRVARRKSPGDMEVLQVLHRASRLQLRCKWDAFPSSLARDSHWSEIRELNEVIDRPLVRLQTLCEEVGFHLRQGAASIRYAEDALSRMWVCEKSIQVIPHGLQQSLARVELEFAIAEGRLEDADEVLSLKVAPLFRQASHRCDNWLSVRKIASRYRLNERLLPSPTYVTPVLLELPRHGEELRGNRLKTNRTE